MYEHKTNRDDNTQYLLTTGSKGFYKEHLFRGHYFDRKNGVKITAMESIAYPDHYFSHEGPALAGGGRRGQPRKSLYQKRTHLSGFVLPLTKSITSHNVSFH